MNEIFLHKEDSEFLNSRIFETGKVVWDKPKEKVWDELFAEPVARRQARTVNFSRVFLTGVAASVVLAIGIGSFLWFYTKSITCLPGQHQAVQLPDGSSVELNAESQLKYYPYRWAFSRDLQFEGEAFFEVQKGKQFNVRSKIATTTVLGTSFNIFSREDLYKVSCLTGKVQVFSTGSGAPVVLTPGQQVVLKSGEVLKEAKNFKGDEPFLWRNNKFLFNAAPFADVASEIGRQYGITIKTQGKIDGVFSGYFTRYSDVEEVLNIVCKPFGYTFVRQDERNYLIVRNN